MVTAASDSAGVAGGRAGLEPEHAGREDPLGEEALAHAGRDGSEVLADDERARSLALEREDGQEVVGRVADVRPVPGRRAPGDPEQPEQAHDVVDAHPAGVAEPGPHRLDERPVPGGAEPVRHERRQPPVLPVEREVVGRRAHRDALGQHVLPRPGVGALAVEADGEVGHQAERPPGPSRAARRAATGPRRETRPAPARSAAKRATAGDAGMPVLGRPAPPPRPVTLGERAEGRELLEAPPLPRAVAREPGDVRPRRAPQRSSRAVVFSRNTASRSIRRSALRPRPWAASRSTSSPASARAGHLLDPQVQRIPVAAARREVRARLLRDYREHGVERIQDRRRPPRAPPPTTRRADGVRQVADAPALPRANRVELDGPAPGPQPVGEMAARGRSNERAAARPPGRPQLVVAEGQIGRQAMLQPQNGAVLEGELGAALDRRERLAPAMDDWAGSRGAHAGRSHRRPRFEPAPRPPSGRHAPRGVDVAVFDAPGVGAQGVAAPSPAGSVKLTVVPWPSALSM